ncbi:hypothetical protein [Nocardioides ungokensis]|uniref:hypothetical protein n=1 Tax=Nocardioides ungokensis TaxID=1643322 RepID=UPI0015DEAFA9|nr:hypothetical protein [Nocardioides ungokensis]
MRFFRDDALLRRAIGAAVALGLFGLWAGHWREDITAQGTYATDTYNAANHLMHTLWALAIVAVVYVAVSLLLTPRATTARDDRAVRTSVPKDA